MPRVIPSEVVKAIDLFFPSLMKTNESLTMDGSYLPQIGGILGLIDEIPQELITLEGEEYILFKSCLSAIRASIAALQAGRAEMRLVKLPGYGEMNPLASIRNLLQKLPDQFPSFSTLDLLFIPDSDMELRNDLRMDVSIVNQALSNGEWKPATIIAGSAIEALLLWSLQQTEIIEHKIGDAVNNLIKNKIFAKHPGLDVEHWPLYNLIEVAGELEIIKSNTVAQCRLARDFRNLIHPGKGLRLKQKCNRATALTAIAALEHVINDLMFYNTKETPQ